MILCLFSQCVVKWSTSFWVTYIRHQEVAKQCYTTWMSHKINFGEKKNHCVNTFSVETPAPNVSPNYRHATYNTCLLSRPLPVMRKTRKMVIKQETGDEEEDEPEDEEEAGWKSMEGKERVVGIWLHFVAPLCFYVLTLASRTCPVLMISLIPQVHQKKVGKKDVWGNDRSQRTIRRDAVPSIRLWLLSWQPAGGGGRRVSAPDKFTGNERAARYGDGGAVFQIFVTGPECATSAVTRARAGRAACLRNPISLFTCPAPITGSCNI